MDLIYPKYTQLSLTCKKLKKNVPPAPPDLIVEIEISFESMVTSTSLTSGMTATVAVDVCTLPCDSVAGTL